MSMHTKQADTNRDKRGDMGLDAPEFIDTVSPIPTGDKKAIQDPVATSVSKVGGLGLAALGFGGNLASINPGPVKKS